jgi:type 1 fimbriae regulatory protein FimB/type 1 fimbriae regulatory protein FimE
MDTPIRPTNASLRKREHLTDAEVRRLIDTARKGHYALRNSTMILVAYRHGLRAVELASLEWSQINWRDATLHVTRVKSGSPSTHPIRGDELRQLRQLQREQDPQSAYVFTTERGAPFDPPSINRLIKRLGVAAKLPMPIHVHMLRHATGYALAAHGVDTRAIQAYLGHKSIEHTVRYTELSPTRFKDLWKW